MGKLRGCCCAWDATARSGVIQPALMRVQDPFAKPCYLFSVVAGDLALRQNSHTTHSGRTITLKTYVPAAYIDQVCVTDCLHSGAGAETVTPGEKSSLRTVCGTRLAWWHWAGTKEQVYMRHMEVVQAAGSPALSLLQTFVVSAGVAPCMHACPVGELWRWRPVDSALLTQLCCCCCDLLSWPGPRPAAAGVHDSHQGSNDLGRGSIWQGV